MVVPVRLADSEARAAIDAAQAAGQNQVLLVPRLDGKYAKAGTLGEIEQIGQLPGEPGGRHPRYGAGPHRRRDHRSGCRLGQRDRTARITDARSAELAREYKTLVTSVLQRRGAWQVIDSVKQVDDPAELSDLAGYASYLTNEQKSWLVENANVSERLEKLIGWVRDHLAELEVSETIQKDVQEGMEKQQREFLLRQQMAAIRKELAELDGKAESEEEDYRAASRAADLPEHVRKAALAEVDKLERTAEQSPGRLDRFWLDTVLEMPWNERTEDSYDIRESRAVLDADHAGLDDVKERITEYLAVRRRRADRGLGVVGGRRSGAVRPWSVLLVWVRPHWVSPWLVRWAEVRPGRTGRCPGRGRDPRSPAYVRRRAAGPDRRAITEAGSMNPVVLLDEIDKVGRTTGVTRRPPCWRCSTRRRTTPSGTTTWRSSWTCPTWSSWPRRTCWTPSRRRCWTGWNWCSWTGTPRTRRSSSPVTTCSRVSWSGRA